MGFGFGQVFHGFVLVSFSVRDCELPGDTPNLGLPPACRKHYVTLAGEEDCDDLDGSHAMVPVSLSCSRAHFKLYMLLFLVLLITSSGCVSCCFVFLGACVAGAVMVCLGYVWVFFST